MSPETDRIPKWLRYCGLNLEVRRVSRIDLPTEAIGNFRSAQGVIEIGDGSQRMRRWATLLHEFGHEIEERCGRAQLDREGAPEREAVNDMYAWGFTQLLVENPGLQEALIADYRETMLEEAEAGAPGRADGGANGTR